MKILQITADLDGGGVDRLLYDYCTRMIPECQFDFVVTSKCRGMLEEPLEALGCKVFHVETIRGDFRKRRRQIEEILNKGDYDVVHDHMGYRGVFSLEAAKRRGVPVRVAHSHISAIPETALERFARLITTRLTKHAATDLFACGEAAANWMWGRNAVDNGVRIMPNAIDVGAFAFKSDVRAKLRKSLGLDGKYVIGNIARFSQQKNHQFLISVFEEVAKCRADAMLILVGGGELRSTIENEVRERGLSDKVLFLGVRNDVPDLLNVMDLFLLPSLYEGLPVTLVEVQANGLAAVVSDAVTQEVALSDNYRIISLRKNEKEWCSEILQTGLERSENVENVVLRYDINNAAASQKCWYMQRLNQLNSRRDHARA